MACQHIGNDHTQILGDRAFGEEKRETTSMELTKEVYYGDIHRVHVHVLLQGISFISNNFSPRFRSFQKRFPCCLVFLASLVSSVFLAGTEGGVYCG